MNIDFGPMTLECEQQNLLDYDETDPDNIMAVSSDTAKIDLLLKVDNDSFPVGLARPWSEVRPDEDDNCNDWGMMFDIDFAGGEGVGSFILQMATPGAGFQLGFDATALGELVAFTQPTQGVMCGDAGSFARPGQWRIKLYSYQDGADYYYVLQVYTTGDALLATASCETGSSCTLPADTDFHVAYAPGDFEPARDTQITISDLWVPGTTPVLPMIRLHGTLGQKRIQEGGNF